MSKNTQLVRLIGSTSIAALISAGSGLAQVIVDPGDTLVVDSGETINDQVILFDGSTLQVESGGAVTDVANTVLEGAAGIAANIVNGGLIVSENGVAIRLPSSAIQVQNSGGIWGDEGGVRASILTSLHNDASGVIRGLDLYGISVSGETETVVNDGIIFGGNYGFNGAGTINTIRNSGLITGNNDSGIYGQSSIGEILNSGQIGGGINGIRSDANIDLIHNQNLIQGIANAILIGENLGTLRNAGLIEGMNGDGVIVGGQVGQFINTGQIFAQNDAVSVNGEISTFNNSGTILGNESGVFANATIMSFTNSGTISGGASEGLTSGDIGSFYNTGIISSDEQSGARIDGIEAFYNAGRIEGADHGLNTFGNIGTLRNEGLIEGLDGDGVTVDGEINQFNNTGQIRAQIDGLDIGGEISTFNNSGTITGGGNGVFANDSIASFTNSGTISGGTGEGLLSGDVNSFHNTGVISSDDSSGALIGSGSIGSIYNAGRIEGADRGLRTNGKIGDFQNHGTITGRSNAGFENNLVVSSFLNTGTISSEDGVGVILNDAETFINSGTIIGDTVAFEINSSTGTDIILRQGSNIQGLIAIEDIAGTSSLSTDPGMNLDLTFLNDVPVVLDTSGSPYVVSGDTIVVVDPSGFSGTDLFANDLSRSVLDAVSSTGARIPFPAQKHETERNVWISGFGGRNQVSGKGVLQDSYGGLVGGVDLLSDNGSMFGLFGGVGTGDISADNSGNTLDTDAVFVGGYYHRDFGSKFLRASLVGGQLSASGSREVFNNLAAGGAETASSDYDGYFVSPSIELGARFDNLLANKPLLASLRISYLHLSEDGYTETGVSNPVTVDDSQSDYLNARAQITLPHDISLGTGPSALLALTAGIDGQFAMGDTSRKATVLGSDIMLDPIYDDQLVRGFLGGSFRQQTRDGRGVFAIGADGFFGGSHDREIRGTLSFKYAF